MRRLCHREIVSPRRDEGQRPLLNLSQRLKAFNPFSEVRTFLTHFGYPHPLCRQGTVQHFAVSWISGKHSFRWRCVGIVIYVFGRREPPPNLLESMLEMRLLYPGSEGNWIAE